MSDRKDCLMDVYGDLYLAGGDIVKTDSIRQAILIRLRWFFKEWQYGPQYGVDYFGTVLVKNPNKTLVLRMIADVIMSVDGVSRVQDLKLIINRKDRIGEITFRVVVDSWDLYRKEMDLYADLTDGERIVYDEDEEGNLRARKKNGTRFAVTLKDPETGTEGLPFMVMAVSFALDNGDLIATYKEVAAWNTV